MPRGPRLDAPGVLHHVMGRGLERRAIFRDERDRRDSVQQLAGGAMKNVGAGCVPAPAWEGDVGRGRCIIRKICFPSDQFSCIPVKLGDLLFDSLGLCT